jgi:hypothetical protein
MRKDITNVRLVVKHLRLKEWHYIEEDAKGEIGK